jgi:NADH-quinone oxidoreductase subunit C
MHETIINAICQQFPEVSMNEFREEVRFVIPSDRIHVFLEELKNRHGFDMLVDVTCVDYLDYPIDEREEIRRPVDRFGLVYILADTMANRRVVVRTFLGESEPSIPTVFDLWRSADWLEREVWDLFGIHFEGHPDLRRIVLPDEFESHPLRKDYPLQGLGERHNLPVIPRKES